MDVTLVTRGGADSLTATDYRDIYDDLRSKCPLRQFAQVIGSTVSFAWWSKYERGEAALSRERMGELRRAVGLPDLPLTVGEAVAGAAENTTVWRVGAGRPDRVVMVGAAAHEPLTMRLNGRLEIVAEAGAENIHVTSVTRATAGATGAGRVRNRLRYFRPCLALDPDRRIRQLEGLLAAARREMAG